jgi:hypothetical protein
VHKWQGGRWSEEVFSKKPVDVIRYVFAIPGDTPADDTVFLAAQKQIFVRQSGKWTSKRVPGEGFPFQMDGTRADQVFIAGPTLCMWDGQKLDELDPPDDDSIRALAVTADDRLVGGQDSVSISTADGGWERIDTPVTGIFSFARLKDDVYALTDEAGVMKVYPGAVSVVSSALDAWALVAVGDGMIAIGTDKVLAFDGKKWFEVKVPLCEKGKTPQ